ncbi:hypothetical protein [Rhizobium sp. RAF56]|uniref:ATP dependent DNA ligase n=1 Tax=Rhizobium sp. RAF56 TaxID=3233062 RepID=UPI003F961A90
MSGYRVAFPSSGQSAVGPFATFKDQPGEESFCSYLLLQAAGSNGKGFTPCWPLTSEADWVLTLKFASSGRRKRNAIWIEPRLVAETEFRAWTADGKLRHAGYKGLRDASDSNAVYEIGETR